MSKNRFGQALVDFTVLKVEQAIAHAQAGGMMNEQTYRDIDAFYAARGGEHSGELDFGVMWGDENPHGRTNYRVSVVHDTGDVYALRLSYLADRDAIILLGTVPAACVEGRSADRHGESCASYTVAERVLDGWVDHIHEPNSLDWVRSRLA